jgi:tetratricopeptide (TPR) repeat protein
MFKFRPGFCAALLLLISLSAQTAFAQTQPSPKMVSANQLFSSKAWVEAEKAYEAIVKEEPGNARAWFQLGVTRLSLEHFEPAIEALQKNIAITNNPTAMYNVACAYARLNQRDKAIEWLNKAVTNKLSPFTNIAADSDLASLRDDARFKELVTTLDKQRRPCIYTSAARQFDFWIGEWDVFTPQGQLAGTSVIQQVSEGCGVLENWTGGFGLTGKSINFYDPNTQRWYQYWIGADGAPIRYAGTFTDGAMRYETEPSIVSGVKTIGRLTFFNLDANTVRQFAQTSTDDGKTWTVSYDFKYVRKKA